MFTNLLYSVAPMDESRTFLAYLAAAVAGIALWTTTAILGGRAEPWDTGIYWTGAYPLAILISAVLGFAFPERTWRWALTLMVSQMGVMIMAGSGLGLLPLGVILILILSLPAVLAAGLAGWLRRATYP